MMAEVTANDFWFLAVALIFLPLTGKNGVVISVSSDCKSKDTDYRLLVNRFVEYSFKRYCR